MSAREPWLYFGCHRESGHYLWAPGMRHVWGHMDNNSLVSFDGALCPRGREMPYIAAFTRLGGWGYSVISFWDYTVDDRPRSNSNFFFASLTIDPDEMLAQSRALFPEVWSRLPPVRWLAPGVPA